MILENRSRSAVMLAVFATFMWHASAFAQLDDELGPDDEAAPSSPDESAPAPEPEAKPEPSAPSPAEAAAAGGASLSVGANTSAVSESSSATGADTSVSKIDTGKPAVDRTSDVEEKDPVRVGSNIRRPILMPDGVSVIDGPLPIDVQTRDWLQLRRQLGGVALPDTTAALGAGGHRHRDAP